MAYLCYLFPSPQGPTLSLFHMIQLSVNLPQCKSLSCFWNTLIIFLSSRNKSPDSSQGYLIFKGPAHLCSLVSDYFSFHIQWMTFFLFLKWGTHQPLTDPQHMLSLISTIFLPSPPICPTTFHLIISYSFFRSPLNLHYFLQPLVTSPLPRWVILLRIHSQSATYLSFTGLSTTVILNFVVMYHCIASN